MVNWQALHRSSLQKYLPCPSFEPGAFHKFPIDLFLEHFQ